MCRLHQTFMALSLWLIAQPVLALPTDKDQEIDIEMQGRMRIDTANEVATYSKNVVVTQGSLKIMSDELTAHGNINNPNKIIAIGEPATLQQQPSSDQGVITVQGNHIEYRVGSEQVLISGNAVFEQSGTTITAAKLFYDVSSSLVEAEAGDDTIKLVSPPRNRGASDEQPPSNNKAE
ncbi:lipopolysaccharide transport periplasmic protein LptA [Aurantivibrio plasticivorans]